MGEKKMELRGAIPPNAGGPYFYTALNDNPRWLPLPGCSDVAPVQLDAVVSR
jgi:hypothetical protein